MESKEIGRPVNIRLHSSIQHPGQEKEMHILKATGHLIEKMNAFYLKYDEKQDGNHIKTMVKLGENDALIMRSGAVNMRLPFDIARSRLGEYGSGEASFALDVKTTKLGFQEETATEKGRFTVSYELHANETLLGIYELTITYTEGTM